MQPSSDHDGSAAPGGAALRRWGPIAAIVVVLALVGGVVALGGDDDTDASPDTTAPGDGDGTGDTPDGAISFSQAEAEGLEVTFPDTCDAATGRVAMPYYFAPECYADVDDNGGATAPGVTADSIKVVVYIPPDVDPVLDFITGPINNDDTSEQVEATYQGFTDMFNASMQTYGRTVELEFLRGSGSSSDEVAARADAVKAMTEMGAFAVWSGPVLSNAWTQEIKARGGVCLGCPGLDDAEPSVFAVQPSAGQARRHMAEYLAKKLAGQPAVFAGDEAFHGTERTFGHLWIDTGSADAQSGAEDMRALLADEGIELAEQIGYELNPGTLQEQATTIIARLKDAGVTSVLVGGDPIAPKTFTEVATAQGYFPEWILGTGTLQDTTAFGRTYDQEQWAHAFGISYLAARVETGLGAPDVLYQWWNGTLAPADDSVGVLWPQPSLFFAGLQAAGPNLTAETFRDGMFTNGPIAPAVTQPAISFGDHGLWDETDYNGIDDFTEIWWDPAATGDDELRKPGTGMYRFVDGGKRYLPGDWTSDLQLFDEAGTVTIYTELPPAEQPPDVPPPAKG
jgi:hypothetical protein